MRIFPLEERTLPETVVTAETVKELGDRIRGCVRLLRQTDSRLTRGREEEDPVLWSLVDFRSAPSTVVFPVPARPTRTPSGES